MDADLKASSDPQLLPADPPRIPNSVLPAMSFSSGSQFYSARASSQLTPFSPLMEPQFSSRTMDQFEPAMPVSGPKMEWDPQTMLSNLTFLEQKIQQVKELVQSISNPEAARMPNRSSNDAVQQQLVNADLTCIVIQLISAAGSLLPSMKSSHLGVNPAIRQLSSVLGAPIGYGLPGGNVMQTQASTPDAAKNSEYEELMNSFVSANDEGEELMKCLNTCGAEASELVRMEEHDSKDDADSVEEENLPPGSYVVLQLEKEEILAPHTHFCLICGKGFKRDANLRMHMRGHGDEYKTRAALSKPAKDAAVEPPPVTRYSCPFAGCKRNKEHKKFQPLKTILCVKNHYKRSHCDKSYTCSRCNSKKFSVIADLKTHEKHCGRDKWLCSCGTTFSRKDKLFGHVALFQGHTPALSMDDVKAPGGSSSDQNLAADVTGEVSGSTEFNFAGGTPSDMAGSSLDVKGIDETCGCFSPMNLEGFGGLDNYFGRALFDVPENPFFLPTGSACNFTHRDAEN